MGEQVGAAAPRATGRGIEGERDRKRGGTRKTLIRNLSPACPYPRTSGLPLRTVAPPSVSGAGQVSSARGSNPTLCGDLIDGSSPVCSREGVLLTQSAWIARVRVAMVTVLTTLSHEGRLIFSC